ncbi:beta-ribofuranosylaminobenzene 5'-phosphate synthase family protein [Halospeciosus flavus]|uniref:Beta-ribofuranosylaminobenzene 5'-phosphate synthase n=1 Tax=Halospeciosus flavus TaxID=3032283 RepID=A0ABD5Z1C4_9EURY|nr:beta-ribofuranosylaminobenzene 5'-phosphate synthase family protein [Halospeciosus flavus]
MSCRVESTARLHFGFGNLSLAHDRLYGSLGVTLDEPRVVVEADPADDHAGVDCEHEDAREYAERAVDLLDVDGARVRVREELPRHVGLGSGTQLALTTFTAVAGAHGLDPDVRAYAPRLGRGGRSGIGVAGFESGGFVVDAGHPTERFTTERPPTGEWSVPPVAAHHDVPEAWRFLVVVPDAEPGRHDADEEASMRSVVESADSSVADRIAGTVFRRVLPAVATGDHTAFGAGVEEVGRLNGRWYADAQGGVYRPPAGELVEHLSTRPAVAGAGQSSWGPAVYGVTDADHADEAREAAHEALAAAGVDGDVFVAGPRNHGATVDHE